MLAHAGEKLGKSRVCNLHHYDLRTLGFVLKKNWILIHAKSWWLWSMTFHMLEKTLIQPSISHFRAIYWSIMKHWRRRNFESKETIVKFSPFPYAWVCIPFYLLLEIFMFISQALHCLCVLSFLWKIEVVEGQVEELGFLVPTSFQERLSHYI